MKTTNTANHKKVVNLLAENMTQLRNIVAEKSVADMSAEYGVRNLVSTADMLVKYVETLKTLKGLGQSAFASALTAAIELGFKGNRNNDSILESYIKLSTGEIPDELKSDATEELWSKACAAYHWFAKKGRVEASNVAGGWTFTVEGGTLCVSSNKQSMRKIDLKKFSKIVTHAERIVVALEQADGTYSVGSNYGLIQRAIAALLADADFSGLEESPKYYSVVVKDKLGQYVAQKAPFFLDTSSKDLKKPMSALGLCMANAGFTAALSVDGYGKQGYMVKQTDMLSYDSLFGVQIGQFISSKENALKLVARCSKQLREGRFGTATVNLKYAVVTMDASVADRTVKSKEEEEAIFMLQSSFGIGCAGGYDSIMYAFGVHRAVSARVLGVKAVLGRVTKVVHPGIVKAVEALASDVDVICGLGSVKAKAADLNWEVVEVNGVEFYIAIVEDVDHTATDSAAALAYENVVSVDHSALEYAEQVAKRHFGTSKTVWAKCLDILSKSENATIVDAIKAMDFAGEIQPKRLRAKANLQMLQSMEAQYGEAVVEEFLSSALEVGGNRQKGDIKSVLDIINPSRIDASRINPTEVDLIGLKTSLNLALAQCKVLPESVGSMVPASAVVAVLSYLAEDVTIKGLEVFEYTYLVAGDQKVLMPNKALITAWEETSTSGKVMVDGLLAELIKALLNMTTDKKGDFTPATIKYTFNKVVKVRDAIAGKQLANIPFFGQAGMICSGWNVGTGQIVSATLQSQMSIAARAYRCDVSELAVIVAKSPCIMYGAVANVDVVFKGQSMTKEDRIIEGTAVYCNALDVLQRQDDADGDTLSALIVRASAAMPSNPRPVDAANPVAHATRAFVAAELKGLFVDFQAKAPVLVQHKVSDLLNAVYASLEAKNNVGLFTSFQQNLSTLSASFKEVGLVTAKSDVWATVGGMKVQLGVAAPVLNLSEDQIASFFATWHHMAGGVTQAESMDRVKRVSEVMLKSLAKVISLGSLGNTARATTCEEALKVAGNHEAYKLLVASVKLHQSKLYVGVPTATMLADFNAAVAALCKATNAIQDGKFVEQVVAAVTLFDNYGISFHDTEIGKAFAAAGSPAWAVNKLVLAFGMTVLREVGKIHNNTVNIPALLFKDKEKVHAVAGNLEALVIRGEVVGRGNKHLPARAEMNLQTQILELVDSLV